MDVHIENRLMTFLQEPWQNHNAFNADAVPVHEPSEKINPKKNEYTEISGQNDRQII